MGKEDALSVSVRAVEKKDQSTVQQMGQAIYKEIKNAYLFNAFTQPTTLGYTCLLATVFYVVFTSKQAAIVSPFLMILYIYLSVRHFTDHMLSSSVDLQNMYDFWVTRRKSRRRLWVATDGDDVIGMVAVRESKTNVAEIMRLYVTPLLRRRGVGKQLLQKAIEYSKAEGFTELQLTVSNMQTPAVCLFESFRFGRFENKNTNMLLPGVFYEESVFIQDGYL